MNYSEWKQTARLVHMSLQMMGKVKVEKMAPQPEWNHVLLNLTPRGFTTGAIPDVRTCFEISIDVVSGRMTARSEGGLEAGFRFDDGTSVGGVYHRFGKMLAAIGHPTTINPAPQEFFDTTPFDRQTEVITYDHAAAREFLRGCTLAYGSILKFVAPLRCKKIMPSMFWGTFDVSTVLFSGEPQPWPGGGVIERGAFDEKMVEFGFWPGDVVVDTPSFYALAWPFLSSPPEGFDLRTKGAFFSPEKMEYFLPLSEVAGAPDPTAVIVEFCTDTLAAMLHRSDWKNRDWFTKPLS